MDLEDTNRHIQVINDAYFDSDAIEASVKEFLNRQRANPTLLTPKDGEESIAALSTVNMPAQEGWNWRLLNIPIPRSTLIQENSEAWQDLWHDPTRTMGYSPPNTVIQRKEAIRRVTDHFALRCTLMIMLERHSAARMAAKDKGSQQYRVEPPLLGTTYDKMIEVKVREVLEQENLREFVAETLFDTSEEHRRIVAGIVGEDTGAFLDTYLLDSVAKSKSALTSLLSTNPGIAAVWLFAMRFDNYARHQMRIKQSGKSRQTKAPTLNHPGEAIRKASQLLGVSPRRREWKTIAHTDSAVTYKALLELRRVRDNGVDIIKTYGHVNRVVALAGVKTTQATQRVLGRALRDRVGNEDAYYPALIAFCREAAKPAKQRVNASALNSEMNSVLDYLDGTLDAHKEALKDSGATTLRELAKIRGLQEAQRKRTWSGFRKASGRWHANEEALRQAQIEIERLSHSGKVRIWDTLMPEYADGSYVFTALTDELALFRQGITTANCLRLNGGYYATRCKSGRSQIYSIERVLYDNAAGSRRKMVGTLEIDHWERGNWNVRMIEGVRFGAVSPTVKKIAEELAARYCQLDLNATY